MEATQERSHEHSIQPRMDTFSAGHDEVVELLTLHRFTAACNTDKLTTMKRSFQSLSTQEALHVAVFIEERNAEIYHNFAEMFASFQDSASLEIAGVLWDMAAEERHHGTLLQERYTARFGQAACALTEVDIWETIELPQLTDQEIFDAADSATTHSRALKVALQAENQAHEFYASLARVAEDEELRALYVELSSFEAVHVEFLQRRLANCTPQG